jgi:ubiquitin carboxyl-terminal hydrolase 8
VVFPLNALDLSRYVPARQPSGHEDLDDPRTQIAPFKYDLYGVSNHMGGLSTGHCKLFASIGVLAHAPDTAFIKSSKGWMFAEDSRITRASEREVAVSFRVFSISSQ